MYLGEQEIVSLLENTATIKGGEKKELTLYEKTFLLSEEPLDKEQFKEKCILAVQTLLATAYDDLNISFATFAEGIRRFDASFMKQRDKAIISAL